MSRLRGTLPAHEAEARPSVAQLERISRVLAAGVPGPVRQALPVGSFPQRPIGLSCHRPRARHRPHGPPSPYPGTHSQGSDWT